MSSILLPKTLTHLQQGRLLLTASKRQADYLHQAYREQQQETVWLRANIKTWTEWVQDSLERLQMHYGTSAPTLLTKNHCLYLLQRIMDDAEDPLLNVPLASKKVYRAAEILNNWCAVDEVYNNSEFDSRLETRQFRDWYHTLEEVFTENHLAAPYQLEQLLYELVAENGTSAIPANEQILLVGFQQLTPTQLKLIELLESHGSQIQHETAEKRLASETRLEFSDVNSELEDTALWAKAQLDQDPEQRIAVIIPELEQQRETIRRIYSKVFQSDYWLAADHIPARPFDISLALPLPDYPMINDLQILLRLIRGRIKYHELIHLLQSRYLNESPDKIAVSALIRELKDSRLAETSLANIQLDLLSNLNDMQQESLAHWKIVFDRCESFDSKSTRAPSGWVEELIELLMQIRFAEESILSSEEYQTKEALYKVLESIASFDVIIPSMTWSDWLRLLRQQLHQRLFQPQTGHCPVQIMGIFEAQSISFNRVRMVGVDNQMWPAKPNPNPFLPYNLQKSLDMPNANAERELLLSTELYHSLLYHCDEIVFSHVNDSLETSCAVSPVIEHLPLSFADNLGSVNRLQEDIHSQATELKIQKIEDNHGIAIRDESIKGGSYLLKEISSCPFQAFAHFRLGAKDPFEPQTDLDGMDKGSLIHKILEVVWRDLLHGSSVELRNKLATKQFQDELWNLIQEQLRLHNADKNHRYSSKKLNLECKRLNRLINEWLGNEIDREPFKVVAGEKRHQYQLNNMTISLTIDRIDQLEDGSYNIIDYKTGTVKVKDWFGKRPIEPQMPLYAAILNDKNMPINAIAYGQVKYQHCSFKGITERAESLPGLNKTFADISAKSFDSEATTIAAQIPIWKEELTELVSQYASGWASVEPKEDKTCDYCDLNGLCRISDIRDRPDLETPK